VDMDSWSSDLRPYAPLVGAFDAGRLSALEFEGLFIAIYSSDTFHRPWDIASPIEEINSAVDAHRADPALRGEDHLDEAGLLSDVRAAFERLRTAVA